MFLTLVEQTFQLLEPNKSVRSFPIEIGLGSSFCNRIRIFHEWKVHFYFKGTFCQREVTGNAWRKFEKLFPSNTIDFV
jgi:hypothetical protein